MNTLSLYQKSLKGELGEEELAVLKTTLKAHPYFSLGHYIRAKQDASHEYLFIASTYSPDRPLLRQYMEGNSLMTEIDTAVKQEQRVPKDSGSSRHTGGAEDLFSVVDFDAAFLSPEPLGMSFSAIVPDRSSEINTYLDTKIKIASLKWMGLAASIRREIKHYTHVSPIFDSGSAQSAEEVVEEVDAKVAAQHAAKAEKLSLLDQFLKDRPEMPAMNPADPLVRDTAAEASILGEGEVVTEALARIHLMQGNHREALEMYQKLRLLFPEKSTYFDVQIEKIQEQI